MIKPEHLDDAVKLRERLRDLDVFVKDLWAGPIRMTFGSYECTVMGHNPLVGQVLQQERCSLVSRLREIGVDV